MESRYKSTHGLLSSILWHDIMYTRSYKPWKLYHNRGVRIQSTQDVYGPGREFNIGLFKYLPWNVLVYHDMVRWEIKKFKLTHVVIIYDNINLYDSLDVPIKSGFSKLLNTTPQSEQ